MDIDDLRRYCLGFPHTTENVQWGADLVFKVDGKMFAVAPLEVAPVRLSFKCSPESFAELCERPDIIPAPYMARAQWVALKSLNAVPDDELRATSGGIVPAGVGAAAQETPRRTGSERSAHLQAKGAGAKKKAVKSSAKKKPATGRRK